jgi:exoribonuclease-2
MQAIVMSLGPAVKEASKVERETNRYWSLEFLRRNSDEIWQATMLRWLREDLGLVFLEELALELPMRFSRSVEVGEQFEVKVSHVDPHKDMIQFQEIIGSTASSAI